MTTDDRLFSVIRRISAIESQLVTRRSFLGSIDAVGARYYRELQELRRELDVSLRYGTRSTATEEDRADVSTSDAERRRRPCVGDAAARVLGQRCAGSGSCSGSVAVRSDRGHRSRNCRCRVRADTGVQAAQNTDFAPVVLKTCPQERRRTDF